MMQNLIYYCRQGVNALAVSNANLVVYPVRFENIIVPSANKIPYDSLSNLSY